MGRTASNMLFSLIPILVGALCGAVGLFLVLMRSSSIFSGQNLRAKVFDKTFDTAAL